MLAQSIFRKAASTITILTAITTAPTNALAANGSFLNGWGANNRALSGAGVARAEDAMTIAINPAGLTQLDKDQWQFGFSLLTSKQTTTASEPDPNNATPGSFAIAPESHTADPDVPAELGGVFPIPSGAISWAIDENTAVGVGLYGNGGVNTRYDGFENPQCPAGTPQRGYYCFGETASDFAQFFVSPTYAKRFGKISLGISPMIGYQTLEFRGLQLFGAQSSDPDKLSNNSHDSAWGFGLKFGATMELGETVSFGLTGQTRIDFSNFDDYAGLLAEQGDFDAPPYLQFGAAWQATARLVLLADYQRIYFGKINAVSNSGTLQTRFGDDNGPGFGWEDARSLKVAARYQYNEKVVLRFGYSRSKAVVPDQEVVPSLLALSVFTHHYNAGLSWQFSQNNTLDVSVSRAPKNTIQGDNARYAGQTVQSSNEIFSLDIGLRKAF